MATDEAERSYLYAFVRCDLSQPQQAVQACHACIEVARSLIRPADDHPHLVLCGVKSQQVLSSVFSRLSALGIACRPFHEPDLNGEMTAVATEPVRGRQRRLLRKYQCLRMDEGQK